MGANNNKNARKSACSPDVFRNEAGTSVKGTKIILFFTL